MMKKFLFGTVLGCLLASAGQALAFDSGAFYNASFTTGPLLAPATFTIDLNAEGLIKVAGQAVYSTVTTPSVQFYDGRASTAAFTISSNTALQAATSFITITVGSQTALAGTTAWIIITVTSNTALAGAKLYFNQGSTTWTFTEGVNWSRNNYSTQTMLPPAPDFSTATAVSIANALNFSTYGVTASTSSLFLPQYMSTGTLSTVIVRAFTSGTFANAWQMSSSTQFALIVAYATGTGATMLPLNWNIAASNCIYCSSPLAFTGGRNPAYLTLTTTGVYRFFAGTDWAVDPAPVGSTATALNIANAMNKPAYGITASTTFSPVNTSPIYLTGGDSAIGITTAPNTVVLRAIFPGKYANAYTIASSTQFALIVSRSTTTATGADVPRLGSGTSNFVEGRDAVTIKIGSQPYTAGIDYFVMPTATATAAALSDKIMSVLASSAIVTSTWTPQSPPIVSATMTYVLGIGTYSNTPLVMIFTSSQTAIMISSVTSISSGAAFGFFHGGFATQIDTWTFTISTANSLTNGMAVLFSTPSGGVPPPSPVLVAGVTYFVMARTPTSFQLSLTSSGSLAGIPLAIATQAVTITRVGNAFSLTPLPFSQSATITWQRSNNGINWESAAVTGSSVTAILQQTLPNSTTFYDFGDQNSRYFRAVISATVNTPSNVTININGKR